MFFHFSQNNSGGNFHVDEDAGIGHHVLIEARDVRHAVDRALGIGLYFNGCADGIDCDCCGDRWSEPWDDKGNDLPMIYGTDVSNGVYETEWSWPSDPSFIHYLNGEIKKVENKKVERDEKKTKR